MDGVKEAEMRCQAEATRDKDMNLKVCRSYIRRPWEASAKIG